MSNETVLRTSAATMGATLRRLVLRLLGFKPCAPHNLRGGWRLYEDGDGFLAALNHDNCTGWYLITDKHGRPFRAVNEAPDGRKGRLL